MIEMRWLWRTGTGYVLQYRTINTYVDPDTCAVSTEPHKNMWDDWQDVPYVASQGDAAGGGE